MEKRKREERERLTEICSDSREEGRELFDLGLQMGNCRFISYYLYLFSAESVMNESLCGQSHFKCIRMLSMASVKIIIILILYLLALLY